MSSTRTVAPASPNDQRDHWRHKRGPGATPAVDVTAVDRSVRRWRSTSVRRVVAFACDGLASRTMTERTPASTRALANSGGSAGGPSKPARTLFAVNAAVAWFGVLISLSLNLSGYYLGDIDLEAPTLLGNVVGGQDTALERFLDWTTYFTILSNIVVAVVMTVLVRRPGLFARTDRVGLVWRALRLDSVIMIVVTGVVYNLLLATGGKTGWDYVSNATIHVVTPILTVLVWLLVGPRGLITLRTIGLSLLLPLAWAAYALVRGSVIGAYPYSFLDVSANGLVPVLAFILQILVVAVVLASIMKAIDSIIRRISGRSRAVVATD